MPNRDLETFSTPLRRRTYLHCCALGVLPVASSQGRAHTADGSQPQRRLVTRHLQSGGADPSFEWEHVYSEAGPDNFMGVAATDDGGAIAAGSTDTDEHYAWAVRIAPDGTEEWSRTYEAGDSVLAVVPASDGYFLVASRTDGEAENGIVSALRENWNVAVTKIAGDGSQQWRQTWGGDDADQAYGAVGDGAGGCLFHGYSYSHTSASGHDVWAVKIDSAGTEQWNETYGEDPSFYANGAAVTADGGAVLVGGRWYDNGTDRNPLVIRVDDQGQEQWRDTFGQMGSDDNGYNAAVTDDGYVLTTLEQHTGSLRKLTTGGDEVWKAELGGNVHGRTILELDDGTFLIGGFRGRLGGMFDTGSDLEAWIGQVSVDGELRWSDIRPAAERISALAPVADGIVAAGRESSAAWATKVTEFGETGQHADEDPDDDVREDTPQFDPGVHGFGFSNWKGTTGKSVVGEEFSYSRQAYSLGEIESITADWPISPGMAVQEIMNRLLYTFLNYGTRISGHCFGMAHAAQAYFDDPDRLPAGVDTASEIPKPTGQYEAVGDLIADYQSSQLLSWANWKHTMELLAHGEVNTEYALENITEAIDQHGTVGVALADGRNLVHRVLAYDYVDEDETIEVFLYENEFPALAYHEYDPSEATAADPASPPTKLELDASSGELLNDYLVELDDSTTLLDGYVFAEPDMSLEVVDQLFDHDRDLLDRLQNSVFYGLNSPAELSVEGPAESQIWSVGGSADGASPEGYSDAVLVMDAPLGEYQVTVEGRGEGEYSLDILGSHDGELVVDETVRDTITASTTEQLEIDIGTDGITSITSTDSNEPAESDSHQSADDDGAGFGTGGVLAGIGGVAYVLKSRLADETPDTK